MTRYTIRFVGTRASVAAARRFTTAVLALAPETAPPPEAVDSAELLVSEVVSNAVQHTRSGLADGSFRLTLAIAEDGVRVEVRTGPSLAPGDRPRLCPVTASADSGRGLALVDVLATEWGRLTSGDNGVYFLLKWPAPDSARTFHP